jgi:hypothetical protein
MPEIQKTRNNQVCQRLDKYCEECARIGSTDCIDHGGPLSEDTSVLGKRLGADVFNDYMLGWNREEPKGGSFKPQLKRPTIPAPVKPVSNDRDMSKFFDNYRDISKIFGNDRSNYNSPFPTRPAPSSSYVVPPAPKLVTTPSMPAPSSTFGTPSPPKFVTPIKPAASVPVPAPVVAEEVIEAATPKSHDTTDLCRDEKHDDNDDTGCKEGGVRFRENLGKYVVEYRPPRFKWKLWMGTYATVDEGRRACDCARYYAGQDKGGFYFKDSPALFEELGDLNRPFSLVSKDVKDKAFNVELKRRAKLVIRNVQDAQRAKQPADVARPSVTMSLPTHIVQQVVRANARTNPANNKNESIPNFSPASSGVIDPVHEENEVVSEPAQQQQQEVAESAQQQQEVASATALIDADAAAAADAIDPFANLCPLEPSLLFTNDYSWNPGFTIPSFNSVPDIQLPFPLQSSLDFDESSSDAHFVELWQHDC